MHTIRHIKCETTRKTKNYTFSALKVSNFTTWAVLECPSDRLILTQNKCLTLPQIFSLGQCATRI